MDQSVEPSVLSPAPYLLPAEGHQNITKDQIKTPNIKGKQVFGISMFCTCSFSMLAVSFELH